MSIKLSANRKRAYEPELYQSTAYLISPCDTTIVYETREEPLPANKRVAINCWESFKAKGATVTLIHHPVGPVISGKVKFLRTVIGVDSLEELLSNPQFVYIGRGNHRVSGAVQSKWANPFSISNFIHKIREDGTKLSADDAREACIDKYREHILASPLMNDLHELRGKTLVCWCKPAACHGDVLADLILSVKK